MARIDKLQRRLESLEAELREILRHEFESHASGGFGDHFLSWERGKLLSHDGKFWRTDYIAHCEKLSTEITTIRGKLGLPIDQSPMRIVHEWLGSFDDFIKGFDGRSVAKAKDCLQMLDED